MAPPQGFSLRKVLLLLLLSFPFFTSVVVLASSCTDSQDGIISHYKKIHPFGRRGILEAQSLEDDDEQEDKPIKKKKPTTTATISTTSTSSGGGNDTLSTKNKAKLIKPATKAITNSTKTQTKLVQDSTISTKNQTKILKLVSPISSKNKTKLTKPTSSSIDEKTPIIKIKLNSTSKATNSTKSTKPTSLLTERASDLTQATSAKNKTTKPILTTKPTQTQTKTKAQLSNSPDKKPKPQKKPTQSTSWFDQEDDSDLVAELAEFRDLPSRFQETLLPDLDIISTTSKVYINRANKEITKGFKPIVGKKYAPLIASIVSCAFIIIPLILVSLIFNRIKAYFSLQKLLIFVQIYLLIYFSILCLSSLVTGLEPLKFFYATSQSTYVCIQLLQTLAYVLYLLMLLMYMVLVFSTETGTGSKALGLGQTCVGFAVGLHYYMTVFHRAVLHQPPKTSWKVHAVYATCFFVNCLLARADRRKKEYLADGGEEGKKS